MKKLSNRPMLAIIIVESLLVIGASIVAYFALRDNLTLLILTLLAAITALIASKFNLWAFGAAALFGGAIQALFDQEAVQFWALIVLFFIGWAFDQFGNWWYDKNKEEKSPTLTPQRNISFAFLPIGISLTLVFVLMRDDFNAVLGGGYETWSDLMLFYAKGVLLSPYLWIGLAATAREINFDVRQVRRFFAQLLNSFGAIAIAIIIFLPCALGSPFIFGVLFELFSENIAIPTDQGAIAAMQFVMYLPAMIAVLAAGWGARWRDQVPVSGAIEEVEVIEGELVDDEPEKDASPAETPEADDEKAQALIPEKTDPPLDPEQSFILDEDKENIDKLDSLLNTIIDDEEPE